MTELSLLRARVAAELGQAEAAVFDAHRLLLQDEALLAQVRDRLPEQGAVRAWQVVLGQAEAAFSALPDPYLRERAADVRAIGEQVLRALLGVPAADVGAVPEGAVLIAVDLTPARAAGLDPARVAAVVLAHGSADSHALQLIRARGIPAVVRAGPGVLDIPPGTSLAVDGDPGELRVLA